jgi:hypothetical protein
MIIRSELFVSTRVQGAALRAPVDTATLPDYVRATASVRSAAGIDALSEPSRPEHDFPRREQRARGKALMQSLRPAAGRCASSPASRIRS